MKKIISLVSICLFLFACGTNYKTKYPTRENIRQCYLPSVALVNMKGRALGSGTIIFNKKGRFIKIITAAHVAEAFQEEGEALIGVLFGYERTPQLVEIIKIDEEKDMALLQGLDPEKEDGPAANISDDYPVIGDDVWLIGSPMGDPHITTRGNITGMIEDKSRLMYRTDAASFYGNSGGGLFNSHCELIGVLQGGQVLQSPFNPLAIPVPVPGAAFAIALKHIRKFVE